MPRRHQRRKGRLGRHPRPRTKDARARTGACFSARPSTRANARTSLSTRANILINICFDRGARSGGPDKKIKAEVDQISAGRGQ